MAGMFARLESLIAKIVASLLCVIISGSSIKQRLQQNHEIICCLGRELKLNL
jgi:hypothetical protein